MKFSHERGRFRIMIYQLKLEKMKKSEILKNIFDINTNFS